MLLFSHSDMSGSLQPHGLKHARLPCSSLLSLLNLMPIKSEMPPNHLILCCPLLLLPSIFPSIRVFSNEVALCIRWPKDWHFSFSISPSRDWFPLGLIGLISVLSKGLSGVFFSIKILNHQLFCIQPSLWSNSHICT